jgi:hypothetical protein
MPPDAAAPSRQDRAPSEEQDALPAPPGDHVPAGQVSPRSGSRCLTQAEHEVIEGARDRPPADPMRFDE